MCILEGLSRFKMSFMSGIDSHKSSSLLLGAVGTYLILSLTCSVTN